MSKRVIRPGLRNIGRPVIAGERKPIRTYIDIVNGQEVTVNVYQAPQQFLDVYSILESKITCYPTTYIEGRGGHSVDIAHYHYIDGETVRELKRRHRRNRANAKGRGLQREH